MTPTEQEIAAHKAELHLLQGAIEHHEKMMRKYLQLANNHLAALQQLEGQQREKELKA